MPTFRYTLFHLHRQVGACRILHAPTCLRRWNRQCSETSAYKIQTPENHPEESTQHSGQGESLKSRVINLFTITDSTIGCQTSKSCYVCLKMLNCYLAIKLLSHIHNLKHNSLFTVYVYIPYAYNKPTIYSINKGTYQHVWT